MRIDYLVAAAVLVAATAACGQGDADNVMASDGSALQPVDVNAALGPEPAPDDGMNTGNEVVEPDANRAGPAATAEPAANTAEPAAADEATANNSVGDE